MFKKIIISLFSLLAFVIIASFSISWMYKDEISSKIKSLVNEKVNAKIDWQDTSLSLLTNFPQLTLGLEKIQIIGQNEFQKDTLASIKEVKVEIPLFSYFISKKITLQSIQLEEANFNLIVNPQGKMNWDIVKKDSTKSPTQAEGQAIDLQINSYQISHSNIFYDDQLRGFSSRLANLNHEGKGDFSQDIFTLSTETKIEQLTVKFLGKTYLSNIKTSLSAPIEMDFKKMKFSFSKNTLLLNELPISVDAWVAMPDTSIDMNVQLNVQKSPFKEFLSLIPSMYSNSFNELNAQGEGALQAHLKGKMNGKENPGFGLGIKVNNGSFQYNSKNIGVKNVQVDFQVNNPDGKPDHTEIQLKKFDLSINNSPIHANLLVKNPVTDPFIQSNVSGNVNLEEIEKIFPLENKKLKGQIAANFALNGKISQFKNGQGMAKGDIQLKAFHFNALEPTFAMQIPKAQLHFNSKNLELQAFTARIGQSDVEAKGYLENYLLYFLKGENLRGNLTVNSKHLNVDELMQLMPKDESSKATAVKTQKALSLPKNIDFSIKSTIASVKYQNFDITSAKGFLKLSPEKIDFDEFSFYLLGSPFIANGFYSNLYDKNPLTNINFEIQQLDIPKAFVNFSTFKKLLPIASAATGKINLNFSLISNLNEDMSPNLNTIQSIGELELVNVSLNGSEVLNKTAELVKFQALKNLVLQPTKINYQISNGRLKVKPFQLKSNVGKIHVSGSNGLDQSLDYQLGVEIPNNLMSEGAKSGINKELDKLGLGINVDAITKSLKPSIMIKGTFQKPLVSLGISQGGNENSNNQASSAVKDVLKTEANKQIDKAKQAAKIQAENIRKEARMAAEKLKEEAYQAADRIVNEAKNPLAQFAAKKLADKLKMEADKKAEAILEEADKKAEELLK
ncbi:MAG: AsmA-like C-terminal region-containing protein [Aquirufa sp.]